MFVTKVTITPGDIRENEELCFSNTQRGIERLINNRELQCKMAENSQKLVDGQGAFRIVESLK